MPILLPTLVLLAKHQRRFPFDIECDRAGITVWKHLADQLRDQQLVDDTLVALREDGTSITKAELREKLNHVVKLGLCDFSKQPMVLIDFLDLFPQITRLSLGPPAYEGGKYTWHIEPFTVASQVHTIEVRELSGDWALLQPFTSLRKLKLWRCRLQNLEFLSELPALDELDLAGCSVESFAGLAKARIKKFSLNEPWGPCHALEEWPQIKGLQHVGFFLTGKVRSFPSCAQSTLREVMIHSCRQLRDLTGLAESPCLEKLSIHESPADQPRYLTPFQGHPTLKEVDLCTFSLHKFRKWKAIFGDALCETEEHFIKIRAEMR